jgi:hypothetical protein
MERQNPWLMRFDDRDVVQYRNPYNNVRFSLPEIDQGLVRWLKKYCDVYHAVLGQDLFEQHFVREKHNATAQILTNAYLNNNNSARVGRICDMARQAHVVDWHSPAFLSQIDGELHFATGQKKIYATGLEKSAEDFSCILWDFDRSVDSSKFSLLEPISDDQQLAKAVGSDDYVLDLNFVEYKQKILPGVYHYTAHYPASYEQDLSELAEDNKQFFQQQIPDGKRSITVLDNLSSKIYDSSGIFTVQTCEHNNAVQSTDDVRRGIGNFEIDTWYFQTTTKIEFDLAHLLLYFRKDLNMFYAGDRSWFSWIHSDDYAETRCCGKIR